MKGIVEAAKSYSDLGLHLVAMNEGSKGPTTANWHTEGVNVNQLNERQNIGPTASGLDASDRARSVMVLAGGKFCAC